MSYQIVLNGLGQGSSAQRLIDSNMDPMTLRPWAETRPDGLFTGRNFITVAKKRYDGSLVLNAQGQPMLQNIPVHNAPATLRQQDWLLIDRAVVFAAKQRLRVWGDVYGANPFNIPNGFGTIAVQHATASGDATAHISMDPIRRGERSRPVLDTAQLPLPVIHSDNSFTSREIAVSRNSGMPLDTTSIALASRKVSEEVEKLTLGVSSSYSYAGGTIYGLTNFPQRSTKSMTVPTGSNGATTVAEVIDMVQTMRNNFFYGPYVMYYSNAWEPWFGLDYATAYPGPLRRRLAEMDIGITAWRNVDYLTGYQMVLVQMTEDVIQGMNGMTMTTVQWQEEGGFEWRFKVLCIYIPRIRANANGKTGINHGTAA